MKKIWFSLIISFLAFAVHAQIQEPVKFKTEWKNVSATEVEVVFTATIDPGWHVYSTDLGDGGPISATFNTDKLVGAELSGKLRPEGKEVSSFDKLFEMNVRYFEHTAQFVQKLRLTGGDYQVTGYLEYGACNDENCLPPTQVEFSFSGKADGAAAATPAGPSIGAVLFFVHIFQQLLLRHGDFAIGGNGQSERHVEVGLRIADTGSVDDALRSSLVIDQPFQNGIFHKFGINQRSKTFFRKHLVHNLPATTSDTQGNAVVNKPLSLFVFHNRQAFVRTADN